MLNHRRASCYAVSVGLVGPRDGPYRLRVGRRGHVRSPIAHDYPAALE